MKIVIFSAVIVVIKMCKDKHIIKQYTKCVNCYSVVIQRQQFVDSIFDAQAHIPKPPTATSKHKRQNPTPVPDNMQNEVFILQNHK